MVFFLIILSLGAFAPLGKRGWPHERKFLVLEQLEDADAGGAQKMASTGRHLAIEDPPF